MTEYIVIVGLVAVALIPVIVRFSGVLGNTVAKATSSIDGHVTRKIGAMSGGSSGGGGGGSSDTSPPSEANANAIPHAPGH